MATPKNPTVFRIREIQVSYKSTGLTLPFRKVTESDHVYQVFKDHLNDCDRENFCILHLSHRNQIIGYEVCFVGTLGEVNIHLREIFKSVMISNAASIVIVHNHPSGDPKPSREDERVTRIIKNAAFLLQIEVLDHIIIANGSYYSFADQGRL